MKNAIKKAIAVILVLVMLSGFGSVACFAEEAAETTTTSSDSDGIKDVVDGGLTFFQQVAKFFYDFLDFLHEQYMKFIGNKNGEDPFDELFNGYWFDTDFIWKDTVK